MKKLKLGVIGMSPGNGHPYSWSAIFNGYDLKYMQDCPFQVIPEYLSRQKFPQDSIKNATVTHIWTQDKEASTHIANACKIENVVTNYKDLIGKVDAILLARDDYQTHYKISKQFIQAGMPIYIDKPLAIKKSIAQKIYALQKYAGQVFTCSAIGFAKEFELNKNDLYDLGEIKYIEAMISKDWERYGIHIIEPTLKLLLTNNILSLKNKIKQTNVSKNQNQRIVTFVWDNNLITSFCTLGELKIPIHVNIFGTNKNQKLTFQDTFYAFKKALQSFVNTIQKKEPAPNKIFTLKIIDMIEKGCANE
ncbi:MAG: Oxidoreductase [candidate division TM6 bacterium GW2011_GWF2_37_49]|nr:MAG: Oxidoreductase [candidate division TM6 bacterium GW2011_GWF2_37_49]